VSTETPGTVEYRVADLNTVELPPAAYDLVAVKGTLHHLIRPDHLLDEVARTLKPNGLFWANDTLGGEAWLTAFVAGGLMLLLPTHVGYRE